MRKPSAILLLGVLSMFFAEVFSGASTLWFFSVWGLLVTLPLYLGHTLFLFNLAIRTVRTSLRQLYFFGMLFGLYEALVTKVLWYGYPDSTGAMIGYLQGVALGEFLTLVLFWHPVMSFILPIVTYEVLSGDYIKGHDWLLKKSRGAITGVVVVILLGAVLQSNGSNYDVLVSVGSITGSLLIISILHRFSDGKTVQSLVLSKRGMIILSLYLVALYGATTFLLLLERLPQTITPYISIFTWYFVSSILILLDHSSSQMSSFGGSFLKYLDLVKLSILFLGVTIVFSVAKTVTYPILLVFFVSFMGIGLILFSFAAVSLVKDRLSERRLSNTRRQSF